MFVSLITGRHICNKSGQRNGQSLEKARTLGAKHPPGDTAGPATMRETTRCMRWADENSYQLVKILEYGYEVDSGRRTPTRFIVEDDRGLWRTRLDDGEASWWEDEPNPNSPAWDFSLTLLNLSGQGDDEGEDDGWREPWE